MRPSFCLALVLLTSCGGPVPNTKSDDPYEKFLGERELLGRTDAAAVSELVALLDDPHFLVVVGAIDVLADMKRGEFLQHFAVKLKHKHPMVRESACAAIAKIQNEEGVPALIDTLKDADPAVRRSVLKALAQFPSNPGAGRAMVEAVADPDPSVSYMAHRLLSERTHRTDVPQTKDDWAKVVK
jgi:HEAT repeat protein